MISFEPLRKTMKMKGVTFYQLETKYEFNKNTVQRFRENKNVTLQTVEDLCVLLDCRIEDVVEIVSDKTPEK